MTNRWRSIAAKLYLLVGLVVLLLAVLIAIAVQSAGKMGLAGAGLYRGVQAVSQADQVETLWERARAAWPRACRRSSIWPSSSNFTRPSMSC